MKTIVCPLCFPKEGVTLPRFSLSEKKILIDLSLELKLFTCKYLQEKFQLTHLAAKFITAHICTNKNQCCNCNHSIQEDEETYCQKCRAFNLNWCILFE